MQDNPRRTNGRALFASALSAAIGGVAVLAFFVILSPRLWADSSEETGHRRFAVICAGAPHDAQHYRWYWGATSGMFDVLRKRYGYAEEDIYFLFCDRHGKDPRVDFVATKANLQRVFGELAERMERADTLFGFFVGHGGRAGAGSDYELTDGRLLDKELDVWRSKIRARTQTYVFTPCHSGGFASVLGRRAGTIVITSCAVEEVNAAGFAEAIRDALNHAPHADGNGDGRVSIGEAYNFALLSVRQWYEQRGRALSEHCQIDDNGDGRSGYGLLPTPAHGRVALQRFLHGPDGTPSRSKQ